MNITIYHNPRCSKSRATLALIEKKVKYLLKMLNLGTPNKLPK